MNTQYQKRRKKLVSLLKKEKVDAFLVTNSLNVSYLTGFSGDDSFLLVTEKDAVLISDPRYEEQIKEECHDLNCHIYPNGTSIYAALKKMLNEFVLQKQSSILGFESTTVSYTEAMFFMEEYSEMTLRPLSNFVEQLREIKDKTEIDALKDSILCARYAFEIIRYGLLPNQTEKEIKNDLEYNMHKLGADGIGFPSIVAVGPRAALPHAVPTRDHRVSDAELLLIDWGAKKNFYISDLTRVLITTSKPSDKLRKIYNIVLDAQTAAIAAIKPGVVSRDVDAVARGIIEKAGYGKMFGHGLGHGLGLQVHERGSFRPSTETILKPGMVLTVEPGIYIPDWGGVRIEDDIVVTKDGCEVLSEKFPKEFDDMIVPC